MICETCHGATIVTWTPDTCVWYFIPCPDCIGGVAYCCEGSERHGQLDGRVTGDASGTASNTVGAETHVDQDHTRPPLST